MICFLESLDKDKLIQIIKKYYAEQGIEIKRIQFDLYNKKDFDNDLRYNKKFTSKKFCAAVSVEQSFIEFDYDFGSLVVNDHLLSIIKTTVGQKVKNRYDFSGFNNDVLNSVLKEECRKIIMAMSKSDQQVLIEAYGLCPETIYKNQGRPRKLRGSRNYFSTDVFDAVWGHHWSIVNARRQRLIENIRKSLIKKGFGTIQK